MKEEKEINPTVIIIGEIKAALAECVKSRLTGYSSPFNKVIDDVVATKTDEIRALVSEAISGALNEKTFREDAIQQIRHKVARELVNSFGEGIFKRTIEKLKQDHTLKARIVLAVEAMIEGKT
jgi:hypothetical protein